MEEITIRDIARMCGVGVSTVSRAMNNHPDINPETKQKILDAIQEYGYIPNNSARNLKRTEARSIAVLVKGMTNPFFSSMIRVMEAEIKRRRYAMVLHHVEQSEDEVDVALELTKEKRLQGIIFLGGYFHHAEEKLEKLHVPFILSTVGCMPEHMSRQQYSSLSVDDEKESCRMVSYLLEQGHRKIAILCADTTDQSIGQLRLLGYRKAFAEHGLSVDEDLICRMKQDIEAYSYENGYAMTQDLLSRRDDVTAVFAISDIMAMGACRALVERGRRVPQDIAVAGFDGIEAGSYFIPSITTIRQPVETIAQETICLLFEILEGREEHQHQTFEAELLVRESTSSALSMA